MQQFNVFMTSSKSWILYQTKIYVYINQLTNNKPSKYDKTKASSEFKKE